MSIDFALALAKRLKREREARDQPLVVLISGDPEPHRLLGRSLSSREAMIGTEVFEALDGESEKQFHRRLVAIARERIVSLDRGVRTVSIGDDTPELECRYDAEGNLRVLN